MLERSHVPHHRRFLGRSLPWSENPLQAHKEWRATLSWKRIEDESNADAPLYTEHSNKLYQSFWGSSAAGSPASRFGSTRSGRPTSRPSWILRGRKKAPASVRTMRTYLAEINRVFTHLQASASCAPIPAAVVLERKRARPRPASQPIPHCLRPNLPGRLREDGRADVRRGARSSFADGWTPARNLALRLVVAECGLKLSEVCKLIPRNITVRHDGTVVIRSPGHRQVAGAHAGREAPLANALKRWIEKRPKHAADRPVPRGRSRKGPAHSNRLFLGQADIVPAADLVGGGLGAARSPIAPDLAERVVTSCVKRTLEELGTRPRSMGRSSCATPTQRG